MQGLSPHQPRQQAQITIADDVPAYRVTNKCGFLDDQDHLWPQGAMIYWEGAPSMGFEPLNDLAHERLLEYYKKLDVFATEMADKNGTSYAGLTGLYEARRRIQEMESDAREVGAEEQMPIMGARQRTSKARSVEMGAPKPTPMMGHKGRAGVAEAQAKGTLRLKDPNTGRAAVNHDDKGLGG